ncbi:unnamed protein product [Camellia sinensis]
MVTTVWAESTICSKQNNQKLMFFLKHRRKNSRWLAMLTSSKRCLLLLEGCKNVKQLKQSHAQVIMCGLGDNNFALSRLLAFCSDPLHSSLSYGWKVFQHIEQPTICICNTLIKAFLLKGELLNTIQIYTHMLRNGMCPDNYTLPYVLKACANLKSFHLGESIHGHCLKLGFLFDTFVGNMFIVMYSAFDDMNAARCVFAEVPGHDVVSSTVLISGYAKAGDVDSARLLFDEAPVKDRGFTGIEPDEAIFVLEGPRVDSWRSGDSIA